MTSRSTGRTNIRLIAEPATVNIDLLLWNGGLVGARWEFGAVIPLAGSVGEVSEQIRRHAVGSSADFLLLWDAKLPLPEGDTLTGVIASGVDIAHCGLQQGRGSLLPALNQVSVDWSTLNAAGARVSTSWRLGLESCLIRRDLIMKLGSLDAAYSSLVAAGLDFGYRCLYLGAIIEHHPELFTAPVPKPAELPLVDSYIFVLRHFGRRWAQYLMLRRSMARPFAALAERKALAAASRVRNATPNPLEDAMPVWYSPADMGAGIEDEAVSVIIPTLGRYPYLGPTINSLRGQTVKPQEIIVVDQNPPDDRVAGFYDEFADLNLRVIYQDAQGQSLARNGGLAVATGEYVFMFDDDSLAHDDLIEQHLKMVRSGRFQVSTGVSLAPPDENYTLPFRFTYPRLAQTFDTGNCLLPLALARALGGLDRNYDFGPGTDTDFGTRLYLAGQRIVNNPAAIRIHFKAPMGGLRTHGARKYNTDRGLLAPFPPVTQSYYGLRYLTRQQRRERTLLFFATSKVPSNIRKGLGNPVATARTLLGFGANTLLLPAKWYRSARAARALLRGGVRLDPFTSGTTREEDTRMIAQKSTIPPWLEEILACPQCKSKLELAADGSSSCPNCGSKYPAGPGGQPDLRLQKPLEVSVPSTYDPTLTDIPEKLWHLPPGLIKYLDQARRLGRSQLDLSAWILDTIKPDSVVLDLGGNSNRDKQLVESLGARYIGIDINSKSAQVLGDAHAIPLADNSVDLVLSMSVFEHLKNPYLAAQELKRVLKPGARVVGIIGFLEAIHGLPHGSYFHHSYFGTYTLFTATGFRVEYLNTVAGWQAIHSVTRAMFPGLPRKAAYAAIVTPVRALQKLWFQGYRLRKKSVAEAQKQNLRILSASVHFVITNLE